MELQMASNGQSQKPTAPHAAAAATEPSIVVRRQVVASDLLTGAYSPQSIELHVDADDSQEGVGRAGMIDEAECVPVLRTIDGPPIPCFDYSYAAGAFCAPIRFAPAYAFSGHLTELSLCGNIQGREKPHSINPALSDFESECKGIFAGFSKKVRFQRAPSRVPGLLSRYLPTQPAPGTGASASVEVGGASVPRREEQFSDMTSGIVRSD